MKNPKYCLLIAAAALSLGACSMDDTTTDPVPEKGGQKISFTVAEDSETRTTLDTDDKGRDILRWVSTDQVGIYTVGKNVNPNTLTTADINQSPVEFTGVLGNSVSGGDMFYAYYPYNAEQPVDPAMVKLTIPAEQTQTKAGVYNGQSQPLVALPMAFSQEWGSDACRINKVRFRLLGAIVELQLFSSDEAYRGEKIQSVKFVSDTPLAGDFTFNLTEVTVKEELPISGYELTEVTTSLEEPADVPAEDGKAALVYLTIAPGTYAGQFVVKTDAAQYTFSLAKALEFKRAVIKGLPADLADATRKLPYVETDPIPFEDQAVKEICVTNWDKDGNKELSYKEAAEVTSLGSKFNSGRSISSFNELQYFTGLQSIEEKAFYNCSNLTSITIPNTVTTIESYAFWGCSGLKSINIPDGVTSIGSVAFNGCRSLTGIELPDGLTTIGISAFRDCSSLTSITIPQTVSSIGEQSFRECSSLSAFNGKYASTNNRCLILDGVLLAFAPANLTQYTIPNNVTSIGTYAFSGFSELTSINIPDGVTKIGSNAFERCSGLKSITIPNKITEIESYTFNGCSSLMSIELPDELTTIKNGAFRDCSSLTSITIPEGVNTIGSYAFRGCSSLASVYCKPTAPPDLGDKAFYSASSSLKIYVPANSVGTYQKDPDWSTYASQIEADENALITFEDSAVKGICVAAGWDTNGDGELSYGEAAAVTSIETKFKGKSIGSFNELRYFTGLKTIGNSAFESCSSLTSIHIPEGVTTIGFSVFYGCSSLTSIHIPDGVTAIGASAFHGCSSLTSIHIPDGMTTIENYTFYNCSSLTSIHLPDEVTEIRDQAFYNCRSLTSIHIPNGVTTIGKFVFSGCSSLTSIIIPEAITSFDANSFAECSSLSVFEGKYASTDNRCLIREGELLAFAPAGLTEYPIPAGVTKIGKFVFRYCSSLTSITIPAGVTVIGDSAFEECSSLTSIHLPDGVTEIGGSVFYKCTKLTSIHIPDSVTKIGRSAFSGCSSLTSITIPVGVTLIDQYTFDNCSSMKSINISDKVTKIGTYAFRNCSSLTSISIPAGVTLIDHNTFDNCSSMKSINISDKVTKIETNAFRKCSSLTSIDIPAGVTAIGISAFEDCNSLTSIVIPDKVTKIGDYAFRYCSKLMSVHCKPTIPPTLGMGAFNITPQSMKIYVPTASVEAYTTKKNWSVYKNRITADDSSTGE